MVGGGGGGGGGGGAAAAAARMYSDIRIAWGSVYVWGEGGVLVTHDSFIYL